MRRFTIAGGRLLTPMRELNGWMLVVRDGVITYAGRYDPDQVVRPILDACGQYIAPGFIDMHTHGGGGHDFMDGTAEAFAGASRAHAAHGTTTLLPTSLVCSDEELLGMFDVFRRVRETGCGGASMPGLHLEGPFFSSFQRGGHHHPQSRRPVHRCGDHVLLFRGGVQLPVLRAELAADLAPSGGHGGPPGVSDFVS